jgi:hypothetical protein
MYALTHLLDWRLVPVMCLASTYAAFAGYLLLEPELNVGHRAGAEGYDGAPSALRLLPHQAATLQPRGASNRCLPARRRACRRRRAVRELGGGAGGAGGAGQRARRPGRGLPLRRDRCACEQGRGSSLRCRCCHCCRGRCSSCAPAPSAHARRLRAGGVQAGSEAAPLAPRPTRRRPRTRSWWCSTTTHCPGPSRWRGPTCLPLSGWRRRACSAPPPQCRRARRASSARLLRARPLGGGRPGPASA